MLSGQYHKVRNFCNPSSKNRRGLSRARMLATPISSLVSLPTPREYPAKGRRPAVLAASIADVLRYSTDFVYVTVPPPGWSGAWLV